MTSHPDPSTKVSLTDLTDRKSRGEKLVMVTAYDHPGARLADAAGVDIILVGDSAADNVLGYDTTVPVTVDDCLVLVRAVARGTERALVVADMPFGSFQVSDETAVANAVRFVKEAGADAVKIEGAGPSARPSAGARRRRHPRDGTCRADAAVGGPCLGGFKAQGRAAAKARRLLTDARALEAAGCFAVVLEAVPAEVARRVSDTLPDRRSVSGPDLTATARSSSRTTSSG